MPKFLPTITLIGTLMCSTAVFAQSTGDAADAVAAGAKDTATQAAGQAADAAADAAATAADKVKDAAGAAAEMAKDQAGTTEQAADQATDAATGTDAQATDTQAADTQATDAPAADATGDAAQQDQGQQEDPTYVKATHGDWEIKCFRADQGEDPCQMFQLLKEDNGNPIAEFSIFKIKQGDAVAGATIVVPLGTLLTEPLRFAIDGGRPRTYPFAFCTMVGCYARVGLTAEEVNTLKRGSKGTLTIVPAQAPDQTVNINVSLSGFTAAYDEASVMGQ